ncbi:lysis protein [Oceanimonas sp. NS1]|nr:lysis protein [Oceanimonas sp. NS1]
MARTSNCPEGTAHDEGTALCGPGGTGRPAGLGVEHYRLSAELADVRRGHTEQLLALEQVNAAELARVTRRAESLQLQIIQLDEQHTKELSRAQQDNNELRDAVDAGNKRLRVLVRRPAHCPAVLAASAVPAWVMEKPSNSVQLLDELITVFEPD